MKTRRVKINPDDLIAGYLPVDYSDCFELDFTSAKDLSADDLMIAVWGDTPNWVNVLFKIRDWFVKPFGLQTGEGRNTDLFAESVRNKGKYGFVETIAKSDQETVISANDKHLRMYLAIKVQKVDAQQQKMTTTTLVAFNNWLGRIYFLVIYPFHQIIVPAMMKHTLKNF